MEFPPQQLIAPASTEQSKGAKGLPFSEVTNPQGCKAYNELVQFLRLQLPTHNSQGRPIHKCVAAAAAAKLGFSIQAENTQASA